MNNSFAIGSQVVQNCLTSGAQLVHNWCKNLHMLDSLAIILNFIFPGAGQPGRGAAAGRFLSWGASKSGIGRPAAESGDAADYRPGRGAGPGRMRGYFIRMISSTGLGHTAAESGEW